LDVDTAQDTWYDVLVRCDGEHIQVWHAEQGETMELVFDWLVEVQETARAAMFSIVADAYYLIDNVEYTPPDPVTTTFGYNDANELTSMTENGVLTTSFTYDDWGRTTGKTLGAYEATYDWRYGDKLKNVESDFPGEAGLMQYVYDGLGKRRIKLVDGTDYTHYRWDLAFNLIAEYENGGGGVWDFGDLRNTFVLGLGEVSGTNPATGNYRYYMTDRLGSVRGIRNESQSVLASYDYSPYGEPYFQAGFHLGKAYAGLTWDPEIGQYYAPYRYYNSSISRWLSRDPLAVGQTLQVYNYAIGNPLVYVDPLGLKGVTTEECLDVYSDCMKAAQRMFRADLQKAVGGGLVISTGCVIVCVLTGAATGGLSCIACLLADVVTVGEITHGCYSKYKDRASRCAQNLSNCKRHCPIETGAEVLVDF